jgi:uncharacterized integral membrane protein
MSSKQQVQDGATGGRSTGDQAKLAGAGVAVGALILFLLQNLQDVEINFLWFTSEMPMIFALAISAGIGAIAAVAFSMLRSRRSRAPRV